MSESKSLNPNVTPVNQKDFLVSQDALLNAPIGIFTSTPDGRFLSANLTLSRMLGYESPEELIGSITDIGSQVYADPADRKQIKKLLEKQNEVHGYECQWYNRSGQLFWVAIHVGVMRNENGDISFTQGFITDITKRKHSEKSLQKIEWMLTGQQKTLLDINLSSQEYIPPYGDLTKLNTRRVILDSVGEETLKNIVSEFLDMLGTSVAVYERNGDYALGLFSSDWCRFMDSSSRRLCETDSNEEALTCGKWLCHESCWDVAKQAIEKAGPADIECEGGLRLHAVPIFANGEIIGTINVGYGDPPDDYSRLAELASKFGVSVEDLTGHSKSYESRPPFIIELAKRRIQSAAALIGEIVEHKQAEKEKNQLQSQLVQSQKMESVGRLAGGMAHEFNNMLSIINGYAEMMTEVLAPSEPIFDNAQRIQDAGKRSAVIIRKLLAFARKQTICPELMNLNDSVSSMLKMLQRLISENIELVWEPEKNLWLINMDFSQVDQILVNLVVNARDSISDFGRITIETKNKELDENYCAAHTGFVPGRFVMLAVSDTGCGMSKEVRSHLFEPFFTTKDVGKGSGLGLPTVYGIVKQNKGFVNVYSEEGRGTTVKIYFPQYQGEKVDIKKKETEEGLLTGNGEVILVLEDDIEVLKLAKIMLENLGYFVLIAGTPNQAMAAAEEHGGAIDLLITDVVMPEMNGKDFANQLKTLYPEIKTLFMSGYTENVIAQHNVVKDGVFFIEKPFSTKELAAMVRKVLTSP